MRERNQFYINGRWVEPHVQRISPVVNPATEETVGTISLGSRTDVDDAVSAARSAFEGFAATEKAERLALLDRVLEQFRARYEEIALAICEEMGAPLGFARKSQAACGTGHLVFTRKALADIDLEVRLNSTTTILREPVGVAGLITPWNWPINQIACKVAPALAAGCTMVLKPSEIAPFSAHLWAEVMHSAGVPEGVFNLVNGDGPGVGSAIAAHPDIDMVSFTGSTRAGIEVALAAAPTIKRVTQELGGKSANILLDDVDYDAAVVGAVRDCMSNSGQSCNAPTRLLVPADSVERVTEIAAAVAGRLVVGDPKDPNTDLGPVVSEAQFHKVQAFIRQGLDEGATLVAGGTGRPSHLQVGFFVKPTVLAEVEPDNAVAQEEIFGPVLSIMSYRSVDEAVHIANATPYGLAGYVSSADPARAQDVARRLRVGMVHINGADGDFAAPFGGYKHSGNGREWGRAGIEEFLEIKAIMGDGSAA